MWSPPTHLAAHLGVPEPVAQQTLLAGNRRQMMHMRRCTVYFGLLLPLGAGMLQQCISSDNVPGVLPGVLASVLLPMTEPTSH
jgi:hypothetical protein